MYYEEKVINGKLCCRNIPCGDWIEVSYNTILTRMLKAENKINKIKEVLP